jgi:hypothetical protein
MNGISSNQQLLQIVAGPAPASIADVIAVMQNIDALLPASDGLKWFNLLYLMVTQQVDSQPPAGGWKDPQWLTRLDIVFAEMYFAAVAGFLSQSTSTPSSWSAV